MTGDASVTIDLGVPGESVPAPGGPRSPARLRRQVGAAAVTLACLLVMGGGTAGTSAPGVPLWTGAASPSGFGLGSRNLYQATVDGRTLVARDLRTGEELWRHGLAGAPFGTFDVGEGVTAVVTTPSGSASDGRPTSMVTFVRERTGELLGRTLGHPHGPSEAGRPLLLQNDRVDAAGCARGDVTCMDIIAWDLRRSTEAWKTQLPPGHVPMMSHRDGRTEGLADMAPDGTVRLLDLDTGTAVATVVVTPEAAVPGGLVLMPEALVTAVRDPDGFRLTAYARPGLTRTWSVTVPAASAAELGRTTAVIFECGRDACLYLNGAARVIDVPTGSIKAAFEQDLVGRIGDRAFLVTASQQLGPDQAVEGLVLDPSGHILSKVMLAQQVLWEDNGDQVLYSQNGRKRTFFVIIDGRGRQHSLGGAAGTDLSCAARGVFLACTDRFLTLRVWRLPI